MLVFLNKHKSQVDVISLTLLLLLLAAVRILSLQDVTPSFDEMNILNHIDGNLYEVFRWTPYDWPPLHFLSLSIWEDLVGQNPFALRMFPVFCFMVSAASLYHILKFRISTIAAYIGTLIFGRMVYVIFISYELRGYSLMFCMILLAWLIAGKMSRRPSGKYLFLFAFFLIAALFTSYISIFPVALILIDSLLMNRVHVRSMVNRQKGRMKPIYWLMLGVILLIATTPILIKILPLAYHRVEYTLTLSQLPFAEAIADWFNRIVGRSAGIIFVLLLVGVLALILQRKITGLQALFLVWGILSIPIFYFLNPYSDFFNVKYSSWITIGMAGFIAATLSIQQRWVRRAVLGISCLIWLFPVQLTVPPSFYWPAHHLYRSFEWLSEKMHADDVVLLAEDQECLMEADYWNHPFQLHLPQGLEFVDTAEGHRRVWFVTADGSPSSKHWETLRSDYIERHFVGPPACLFRLYEGPPDREGRLFDNGMRFHGAQFMIDHEVTTPGVLPKLREGEKFHIRFWWSNDRVLKQDYSVGTFFLKAHPPNQGEVLFEKHGPPLPSHPSIASLETSQWQVGQWYYEDRELQVPYPFLRQMLDLRLAVYHWETPSKRYLAEGTDSFGLLPVMQILVDTF